MNLLVKPLGRYPLGVWFALAALAILFLVAWAGQAYSLIDWDGAVELGLQNDRFTGDEIERTWAKENWGIAVADMLWPVPIGIIALVGLLRRKFYGFAAGLMEFSIGVYFPLVFSINRWSDLSGTAIVALCLFLIPSLLGIAGLWFNRHAFEQKYCTTEPGNL